MCAFICTRSVLCTCSSNLSRGLLALWPVIFPLAFAALAAFDDSVIVLFCPGAGFHLQVILASQRTSTCHRASGEHSSGTRRSNDASFRWCEMKHDSQTEYCPGGVQLLHPTTQTNKQTCYLVISAGALVPSSLLPHVTHQSLAFLVHANHRRAWSPPSFSLRPFGRMDEATRF